MFVPVKAFTAYCNITLAQWPFDKLQRKKSVVNVVSSLTYKDYIWLEGPDRYKHCSSSGAVFKTLHFLLTYEYFQHSSVWDYIRQKSLPVMNTLTGTVLNLQRKYSVPPSPFVSCKKVS